MKVFSTEQIRAWDAYTIENEPVTSLGLMDRAARVFTRWFTACYPDAEQPVWVFAGTGNNGGDGLAVAGLLHRQFYPVKVFICAYGGKHSADFDAQLAGLPPHDAVSVHWLKAGAALPPAPPSGAILIDAMFGTGLTRPLEEPWASLIDWMNGLPNDRVAIDLPSGLLAGANTPGPCIRATRTFSFETPKRAFFFSENAERVGEWTAGSIGLHPDYALRTYTPFHYITADVVQTLVRPRKRFSHKGVFGHALLINGSMGKVGASVLSAIACLRAGVGLLTVHTPRCGYPVLQAQAPEAMCSVDKSEEIWTELPDLARYSAIGAGCGIGQDRHTAQALKCLIQQARAPLVLDADALNILALHPKWFGFLPKGAILTPHPKEFERLFGKTADSFARNALQCAKAQEYGVYIVLKGACTAVACPDGACWFNSTGNPGMATGGSGDVLTGLLTGLLAQGYPPEEAAVLGVWLHGLAGDLAAVELSQPGMTAGDIIRYLGKAWLALVGR
ncbi:MAG: NAD(P)H-hydrate dehydratase [Saprospirales bacterium]|nr:NAD(P)H-hydrate dehydratase [Saprospirales bacterium]